MTPTESRIEWAPIIVGIVGLLISLVGLRAFYLRGDFGVMDVVRCGLLLIPAGLYLLVTSYVVQHARLVAVIPLIAGVMLVIGHPSFAVALGLALIAAVFGPAFRDWREARQSKETAAEG
jgi:hypothetical protein